MTTGVLAALALRDGWVWMPLGRLAERQRSSGQPAYEPLSVFLDGGVVPRSARQSDNHNRLGESLDPYLVVEPGDLVFNKLRTWQGGFGHSRHRGIVSPAYFVLRPAESDCRYLDYLLHSAPYLRELTRRSKWMPPSQFDIAWEDLRSLPVLKPPQAQQRRIADFLDAETVRIDAVITAKQQMISRSISRDSASLGAWWTELTDRFGIAQLRRFGATIEQGWSPACDSAQASNDEWGVLKTSAVTGFSFDPSQNKRLPAGMDPDVRWKVEPGDLLMVRGSGSRKAVGAVAVADPADRLLTISDLLYRIRGLDGVPDFHAAALRSPQVRQVVEGAFRTDSGQTLKLRSDDIRDLPHPAVPAARMEEELADLERRTGPSAVLRTTLTRQIELLRERRQALITAAVSGELEI